MTTFAPTLPPTTAPAVAPQSAAAASPPPIAELERTWRGPGGLWGWLTAVDHKSIGARYTATTFLFFALAGLNAALMRAQLARPNGTVLGAGAYNQAFTVHGTAMMFLFAVPVMTAFAIYFVP